jgi:hypothetical protein
MPSSYPIPLSCGSRRCSDYFVIVCRFGVDVVSLRLQIDFLFSNFANRFLSLNVPSGPIGYRALFADPDRRGSIRFSLMKRGLWCGFLAIGSLSLAHIVRVTHFLSIGNKHFTMSSKRREYHVDRRSKKAALFFVACDANPDTRVKSPMQRGLKGTPQARPPIDRCRCRCVARRIKLKERLFLALLLLRLRPRLHC